VWPFCFWLSVVIDHFSRRVLAIGVTLGAPSAAETCKLLNRARRRARRAPKCIVTDQGVQFRREYRTWCQRRGVEPRYGAVGKHGSIALVERFWRSMKGEAFGARRRLVPLSLRQMVTLSERYVAWYNESRPHQGLAGQTPREAFERARPLHEQPRFEPRARYPDGAPCAAPLAPVRGAPGERLSLVVRHPTGLPHLPVIELRAA
jgi:putative transposase